MAMAPIMRPMSGPSSHVVVVSAAPGPERMQMDGIAAFGHFPAVQVDQEKKNWLFEMCCWETESRFRISAMGTNEVVMYGLEESSCCARVWCGPAREARLTVRAGGPMGPVVAKYYRPLRCSPGCCCCEQEMLVMDEKDLPVARAIIPFYCCCDPPRININMDPRLARPPILVQAQSCCMCYRPAFDVMQSAAPGGRIQKLWGGMARECCTNADIYQVVYPQHSTPEERAAILGAAFLLDYAFFEQDHNHRRG